MGIRANLKHLSDQHALVVRFMVSFLIILLIPVLIGTLVYQEAIRIVEEDTKASALSMLNQCRDVIDRQLAAIDITKIQIGLLPQLNYLLYTDNRQDLAFYYQMNDLKARLRPYTITNDFMADFFIFMKRPDYIIAPAMAYDVKFFFERILRSHDIRKERWLEKMDRYHAGSVFPASKLTIENREYFVIPYIHSLPTRYSRQVEGAIVFLLNAEVINKMLSRVSPVRDNWVFILNREGQIITGLSPRRFPAKLPPDLRPKTEGFDRVRYRGEEMIVSSTTSPYNGWTYVNILPSRLVMGKVTYIRQIVWGSIILSLLVGAMIAYLLTARNLKPLKRIIDLIKEHFGGEAPKKDAFEYLQGSVSELIHTNQSLQETLKSHLPMVKTGFFDRLLKGEYSNRDEIAAISSYLGLRIHGDRFLVLLVRIYSQNEIISRDIIEESHIARAILRETLAKHIGAKGFLHDLDPNQIAIILAFNKKREQDCLAEAEQLMRAVDGELLAKYKLKVAFAGGSLVGEALTIWQSYEEAKRALDYGSIDPGGKLIWHDGIPAQGTQYYYPIDFEQRLINLAKAGELKQVQNLLQVIYRENVENKRLSQEMSLELAYEMKGTVVKICSELQLSGEELQPLLETLGHSKSFAEFHDHLVTIYQTICQAVTARRKWKNVQLKEQILEFINSAYPKSDLSLYKVASQFGLSEGYLSHFFKDQVGENFVTYLERLRIERACQLLKEGGEIAVNDVAEQVGYNSVYSFRRAFKRVKGINPAAFRTS
jgi:two-component system response regulator YesN